MVEADELLELLDTMTKVSLHQCNRESVGVRLKFGRHPLTCGKNSSHGILFPVVDEGKVKLICPCCDYTQDNAGFVGW